jgi:hypothetical protein
MAAMADIPSAAPQQPRGIHAVNPVRRREWRN